MGCYRNVLKREGKAGRGNQEAEKYEFDSILIDDDSDDSIDMEIEICKSGRVRKITFTTFENPSLWNRFLGFMAYLYRNDVPCLYENMEMEELSLESSRSNFTDFHYDPRKGGWLYTTYNSDRVIEVFDKGGFCQVIFDFSYNPSREFASWVIHALLGREQRLKIIPPSNLERIDSRLDVVIEYLFEKEEWVKICQNRDSDDDY